MPAKTRKNLAKVEKAVHLLDARKQDGRQHKATDKYLSLVKNEQTKAQEIRNRANMVALRRRQKQQEENNFHDRERTPVESEDEDFEDSLTQEHAVGTFSIRPADPAPRARNTAVHARRPIVDSDDERAIEQRETQDSHFSQIARLPPVQSVRYSKDGRTRLVLRAGKENMTQASSNSATVAKKTLVRHTTTIPPVRPLLEEDPNSPSRRHRHTSQASTQNIGEHDDVADRGYARDDDNAPDDDWCKDVRAEHGDDIQADDSVREEDAMHENNNIHKDDRMLEDNMGGHDTREDSMHDDDMCEDNLWRTRARNLVQRPSHASQSVSRLLATLSDADMSPEPIPSPPPSPSPRRVVRRRHDRPSTATLETARLTKVRRTRGAGSRGRFRVKDFKSVVRSLLLEAIGHYRTRVSTEYAYPTNTEEESWAIEAWSRACRDIGIDLPMEDEFVSMITARASHVRGELKTKARILVEQAYGLTAPSNQDEQLANRNKVRDLLTRLGYAYADPTARSGIYENKVIQCLVNVTWFADPKDEGVRLNQYFGRRMPVPVIALVLTAIQNVLHEWQTGEREDIAFSKKHYKAKYDRHLEEHPPYNTN